MYTCIRCPIGNHMEKTDTKQRKAKKNAKRNFYELRLRIVKLLNLVIMCIPFSLVWLFYYAPKTPAPFIGMGNLLVIFLFGILYVMFGRTYDAFLVSYNRISEMVLSQALAVTISEFVMYIVICLLSARMVNILPLLFALLVSILLSGIWATEAHNWYFRSFEAKKTAVVWDQMEGLDELIDSYGLDKKFNVILKPSVRECIADLSMLDGCETVFLSGVHSHDRNIIIKYCIEKKITMFIIPRIGDVLMSGAHKMHMFHLPILRLERYHPSPEYLFVKRAFDLIMSLLGLIILSPVLLITALCVKRDGGPAFYKQTRLTKDGKEFNVLKFRSMRVDAESDGVARLSTGENDDRITPVGRFIRKTRIDELPQLINILMGDMSIVGPRPERPEIAAQYEKVLPEFRLRLQAKCGLTGYAQVYGKYNTSPYDKLQMDLMYISNPSIGVDLSIIFATIKILFMPESTEGIESGAVTAIRENHSHEDD